MPVLIVEDDQSIRDVVSLALTDEGYHVLTARNGAEALDVLLHATPNLILLNLHMPVMSGHEFLARYRGDARQSAPVVLFTALPTAPDLAARLGAADLLLKPYELTDLLSLVRRYVRPRVPESIP